MFLFPPVLSAANCGDTEYIKGYLGVWSTQCRLGELSWKQSCVGDSASVVLSLAFTVLGVKRVGRNHSRTLCVIIGLCRDLLLVWCSVGQFLAPLLFTATPGAAFCSRPPQPCCRFPARTRFMQAQVWRGQPVQCVGLGNILSALKYCLCVTEEM